MAARTKKPPAPTPSEVVAREVRRIRTRKEWTQDDLAQALNDVGWATDRGTVAKIEARKRGVSVDDVFTLAVALGVSPLSLMLPRASDDPVRLAGAVTVDASRARVWARGLLELEPDDHRFFTEEQGDEDSHVHQLPGVGSVLGLAGQVSTFGVPGMENAVADLMEQIAKRAAFAAQSIREDLERGGNA